MFTNCTLLSIVETASMILIMCHFYFKLIHYKKCKQSPIKLYIIKFCSSVTKTQFVQHYVMKKVAYFLLV